MSDGERGSQIVPWLWERRDEVLGRLKDLFAWIAGLGKPAADPPRGLLIIGPGGVGKTTLARLLSGRFEWLLDDPSVEIVVPPGQSHRREATWSGLEGDIAAGRFAGVILLTAYGHHTLRIPRAQHPLHTKHGDSGFVEAYLADRRKEEVSILRRLAPFLRTNQQRTWMLSLIAKQDLWWESRAEVERHYQEGAYGREVRALADGLDARRFRHEFAFASLVIANLTGGDGEILKPNAAGYDHARCVGSLRRVFETVDALRRWEAEP
jgi:hypothetical protein